MAVEVLRAHKPSLTATAVLVALIAAMKNVGERVVETKQYRGDSEWLMLFGVGADAHSKARDHHVKAGGKAMLWDLGYFGRRKETGYVRGSINTDHPQALIDRAPTDPSRWDALGIRLREDYKRDGHIILVGLGRKSRAYFGDGWEQAKYTELVKRFPPSRIVYRPKVDGDIVVLPCARDGTTPIESLLRGAALVVCKHSNVACDAAVAGVPFESTDGAAMWLAGRDYTQANRMEFLQRLAWFQWRPSEAKEAWQFFKGIV